MVAVWLISSQAWFLAKTAILRWLALLFAVGVPLRQSLDCGESGNIDFAAKLSDAADQAFFGYAVLRTSESRFLRRDIPTPTTESRFLRHGYPPGGCGSARCPPSVNLVSTQQALLRLSATLCRNLWRLNLTP